MTKDVNAPFHIPVLCEADVAAVLRYADITPLMRETLIEVSAAKVLQPVRQMLPVEDQQRYLGIIPALKCPQICRRLAW